PTREYQRDSPSDLLLRRPQGIKPKKKIVKIRDSGLTRKVISTLTPLHSVRLRRPEGKFAPRQWKYADR
ncbi:hypothetical protein FKG77_17055, partial [Shigella sonnei]|nr:hypothetical protein [Shigella sonnei]EFW2461210.1 hypothetical protein [Shigella sonnei]EFW5526317.1 hypothetical protein [Shigella sonnei]EFW7187083.1 hypothetical protein [Shigella sonnei]EFX0219596.1 hypothetical protein [Shigella sonnei]